jgi:hypothetical protein
MFSAPVCDPGAHVTIQIKFVDHNIGGYFNTIGSFLSDNFLKK